MNPDDLEKGDSLVAQIIHGRSIAAQIWSDTSTRAAQFETANGKKAHLAVLRVADDPASVAYGRSIVRQFGRHGLAASLTEIDPTPGAETVERTIRELGADSGVHGILLQLPLPIGFDQGRLVSLIPPLKDLEGLRPDHAGLLALGRPRFVPSTPLAGLELLQRSNVDLAGKLAVVIGRSPIIGRPLASLLLSANCTVVICHSFTANLASLTRQADLLFAATGRPGLLSGPMVKPGAIVVDFGTTVVDGQLVGDVEFSSVSEVAALLTPVPGGVGAVTTAVLGRNLLQAAHLQSAPVAT